MAFGSLARRAMVAARNNVPLKTDTAAATVSTGGFIRRIAKNAGATTPVSASSNTQAANKLSGSFKKIKRTNLFGN